MTEDANEKALFAKRRMNDLIERAHAQRVALARHENATCLACLDTGTDCGRFCRCEAGAALAFGLHIKHRPQPGRLKVLFKVLWGGSLK
jgi:hypothetical protein